MTRRSCNNKVLTSIPPLLTEKSNEVDDGINYENNALSLKQAENLLTNLDNIRDMIKKKKDPYAIFEKIVIELMDNYKKCCDIIKRYNEKQIIRCDNLNDQIVSLENETLNKISDIQQQSEYSIDTIDVTQKCKDELNILWISFTDPAEIENLKLKSKANLFHEAKMIFNRMGIQLDGPHEAIVDVSIQRVSVKSSESYENELIMGIKFTNSFIVKELKRQIYDFGKKEFLNNNFDLIRYSTRNFWSCKIWKLLRVCNDLKNFKLLESARVTEFGIAVSYKKKNNQDQSKSNSEMKRRYVKNEKELNLLRLEVNDMCCDISAFQIYGSNYLKLNFDERKKYRNILTMAGNVEENCTRETNYLCSNSKSITNLISPLNKHSILKNH